VKPAPRSPSRRSRGRRAARPCSLTAAEERCLAIASPGAGAGGVLVAQRAEAAVRSNGKRFAPPLISMRMPGCDRGSFGGRAQGCDERLGIGDGLMRRSVTQSALGLVFFDVPPTSVPTFTVTPRA
jgi:hypothetical protein